MSDRARQRFGVEELAIVLSRYDLGAIESITEFERGSRRSPKVLIASARGRFLLKRRAARRRSRRKVALAHLVQKRLADAGFPLPRLVPVRGGGSTVVSLGNELYELFEFVAGDAYGPAGAQARDAGRTLARFHAITRSLDLPDTAPSGTYHDTIGVRTGLNTIPRSISSHDSVVGRETDLTSVTGVLFEDYDRAAETVNRIMSTDTFPVQIVHADWHPGNMLFRGDRVLAVMDYDSCRVAERVTDVANGALHFSLISGGHPDHWPAHPDEERFAAFVSGYRELIPLSHPERQSVPHLMIEALIAESVLPIVHAGSFGQWASFGFLRMVARKVQWLLEHQRHIVDLAGS